MSLINEIKVKQLAARKASSPEASLYTTLLGEALTVGKNDGNRETTNIEVVAVVKKFIKGIDETVAALSKGQIAGYTSPPLTIALGERNILEKFLPAQLNEEDLMQIIQSRTSMPDFMKYLKENYAGSYDGKLAAAVAKKVFV